VAPQSTGTGGGVAWILAPLAQSAWASWRHRDGHRASDGGGGLELPVCQYTSATGTVPVARPATDHEVAIC
jgi:hypothetical protein